MPTARIEHSTAEIAARLDRLPSSRVAASAREAAIDTNYRADRAHRFDLERSWGLNPLAQVH